MQLRFRDDRVAVYDDFLPAQEQEDLLRHFEVARFHRVLPDAWGFGFQLDNGDPLVGDEIASDGSGPDELHKMGRDSGAYPSGSGLDILVSKLSAFQEKAEEIVGQRGRTWDRFTVCPYVYPRGSGLGWHTDPHCAGAYMYYVHRRWESQWGGELLVEYRESGCDVPPRANRGILDSAPHRSLLGHGLGYFFSPLPNRLVILRSRTPHMIKAVAPAAGDNLRLSVSGFFLHAPLRSR